MDDGRYIVSFSTVSGSDPTGQVVGLTNGVHQSQLIQPTAYVTQQGQFATQTNSYPSHVIQQQQQPGYSVTQNTQYLYPSHAQPVYQHQDVIGNGIFKTTIPTGSSVDLNDNVHTTPHIHTVDLADVLHQDVTSTAAPSSDVTSTTKGVRQKVKGQGETAKDAEPATKRKQKGKAPAAPKEKVDTKSANKKQTKQKADNSRLVKKRTKTPQSEGIEELAEEPDNPIESGSKPVRRRPQLVKSQHSVVTDIFVEQVQAAKEAHDTIKPSARNTKVIKPVGFDDDDEEAETHVKSESRVQPETRVRPGTRVEAEVPSMVPETSSDHTLTRVRVLHVTPDGTQSIRLTDTAKQPPKLHKKPTVFTSSIQTQTEAGEEEATIPPSAVTDLYSAPQTVLSSREKKHESQSGRPVSQTLTSGHVDQDHVVWTARSQNMEQGAGDADSGSEERQRNSLVPENTYATIIKPYGQSSVIHIDEPEPDPEPTEPPPVPQKTQEAFEKIYEDPRTKEAAEGAKVQTDELTPSEAHQLAASLDQIAFVGTKDGENVDNMVDDYDPYSMISDVNNGAHYTPSAHGTISSSGTGHSMDSDGKESVTNRIMRIAKEMRDNGDADVYENINAVRDHVTEDSDDANSDVTSENGKSVDGDGSDEDVEQSNKETSQNGFRTSQEMAASGAVGATPVTSPGEGASQTAPNTPFTLPLGFKINEAFTVYFHRCDITRLKTDVIVSVANSKLKPEHGVAKAIAKAAGKDLEKDSKKHVKKNGPIDVGDVVSTKPGKLQCGYVFHAVGPKYKDFKDKNACKDKLRQTYDKVFEACWRHKVPSVAIPLISAGKFGVPNQIIAACIYESLFMAAMKQDYQYTKNVHIVNLEPAILLAMAEAVSTRPAMFQGKRIKVEQLERKEVRRVLEQRVIRKKSSSSKSKDDKKSSSDGKSKDKSKDDKSRGAKAKDDRSRDTNPKDNKSRDTRPRDDRSRDTKSSKSSTGSSNGKDNKL